MRAGPLSVATESPAWTSVPSGASTLAIAGSSELREHSRDGVDACDAARFATADHGRHRVPAGTTASVVISPRSPRCFGERRLYDAGYLRVGRGRPHATRLCADRSGAVGAATGLTKRRMAPVADGSGKSSR